MPYAARVAVKTLAPLLACAARSGLPASEVLGAVGLDAPDPETLVPYDLVTRMWQYAARETTDDAFGVHVAERAPRGAFEVVEYAALASFTLGDALAHLCRYQRLVTEVATYTLHDTRLRLSYRLGSNRLAPSRHASEYLLACVVLKLRGAAAASPTRVTFRHDAPTYLGEHRRVFDCPLTFGDQHDEIVYARDSLAVPLERADPALRSILDRHAAALLERLPKRDLFSLRVSRWLRDQLATGDSTLSRAAAHFHVSERGLQRRLEVEGETFETLLERARRGEAERLLADRRLEIAEVAFQVGFSGPSAFHRAFKRWTGVTPIAYRRSVS